MVRICVDSSKYWHVICFAMFYEFKLETKIKSRCASEKKRPKDIFDDECLKKQKVSSGLQFSKRVRSLVRHQTRNIPKNPKTIEEAQPFFKNVDINRTIGKTLDEEPKDFYFETVVTSSFAYQIYFSEKILEFLPLSLKMRIDGTFKVVPKGPFMQLLIISVEFRDHVSRMSISLYYQAKLLKRGFVEKKNVEVLRCLRRIAMENPRKLFLSPECELAGSRYLFFVESRFRSTIHPIVYYSLS